MAVRLKAHPADGFLFGLFGLFGLLDLIGPLDLFGLFDLFGPIAVPTRFLFIQITRLIYR